ncbi:hypothetical protein MMU07_15110 [Aquiflexum sp. LQ15W]|uniref:hypothetical protein n=1 Tax=Cognataquiflexum nitidum TaxID=2922272 RepID=UPI001F13D54C|nr:hypothetical protein [Cognataquiflexum nitidum]MCH6200913.1 hypothetical protein [Cognataquiflexum nitidum]
MKRLEIIWPIFILLGFFGIIIFFVPNLPNRVACQTEKSAMGLEIRNGIITDKYLDSLYRDYETIKYKIGEKERETYLFRKDLSRVYDFFEIGDTVYKEKKDLKIRIFRSGMDTTFVLDFDCTR